MESRAVGGASKSRASARGVLKSSSSTSRTRVISPGSLPDPARSFSRSVAQAAPAWATASSV